jgi:hypothetical protein
MGRTMSWIARGAVAMTLAVGLSATAVRADLVVNGGFEDGPADFNPPPGWNGSGAFVADSSFDEGPHTGNNAAFFGAVGGLDSISQDLATTAGASYTFSFWLASDGGLPNQFVANWDGTDVLNQTDIPSGPYIFFSFDVTASGATTTITFSGRNDPTWLALDDVSVTPRSVPEPGSLIALTIGGLLVAGSTRLRRRVAA